MMGNFGLSFDPSASQQGGPGSPTQTGAKPGGSPIQQAIQYLSLRMPKVVGSRTPTDPRLLAGSPQAGLPSPRAHAVADSILKSILGPEQAQGLTVPSPMPSGPSPAAPPPPSFSFPGTLAPPSAAPAETKPEPTKTFSPGPSSGPAPSAPAFQPPPVASAQSAPPAAGLSFGPPPSPQFTFNEQGRSSAPADGANPEAFLQMIQHLFRPGGGMVGKGGFTS